MAGRHEAVTFADYVPNVMVNTEEQPVVADKRKRLTVGVGFTPRSSAARDSRRRKTWRHPHPDTQFSSRH
jgi:hypothetical protein